MAPEKRSIGQRVDDALTRYLRNTTTDQEILDFYGEGNIVGRKGIPSSRAELLNQVYASRSLNDSPLRPTSARPDFAVGGIDQEIGYDYRTSDLPDTLDPKSKRAWQMTFGELPKDFGSSQLTPAAKQFLEDFRVPQKTGSDFSFATGPNIKDRIDYETAQLVEDPTYKRRPELLQERLSEVRGQSPEIGAFSGQPQTPRTWKERGYISQAPENLKANVLRAFKDKIFDAQGPFGGVSTLTPVRQSSATNPDWRADLYEKAGLAGPISEQPFASGYGGGTKDVQRFTTGNERLLPLQPYTEFIDDYDATKPSALGTEPAPDFTPLQKQFGTRNYLIARNLLQGRGIVDNPALRRAAKSGLTVGAADFIPSREAIRDFYSGDYGSGAKRMATDVAMGVPLTVGTGLAAAAFPAVASSPLLPAAGTYLVGKAGYDAADEAVTQQTGESIRDKVGHTLNKFAPGVLGTPSTGSAYAGSEHALRRQERVEREGRQAIEALNTGSWRDQPLVVPKIEALTGASLEAHNRQQAERAARANENELQRRFRLAKERFNPSRGEFGLTELFAGR